MPRAVVAFPGKENEPATADLRHFQMLLSTVTLYRSEASGGADDLEARAEVPQHWRFGTAVHHGRDILGVERFFRAETPEGLRVAEADHGLTPRPGPECTVCAYATLCTDAAVDDKREVQ
jgi:hypothetical protein